MNSDFHSYLKKSIGDASKRQQSFYVSTDAIERPQLKLMAQKVAEKRQDAQEKEKVSPVPVLEGIRAFCKEHHHVLLVGRPGSGKSTALNQLFIEEATRSLEDGSLPIPVLVQLKSDQPILQLIQKALRRGKLRLDETEIDDLLIEEKLLLLLDGINEIPRQDLQQAVQEFREDNLDVPMIFTTRDLASGGYLGIEKQLEMQPLTPAQLRDFVEQYFPEQTSEFLNRLSDRLKELGETPLLLEMLCDVFRRSGKIPTNLGLAFREFTQHYERNLKEGVRIESDRELWKPVLQQLAWVMMQGKEPTEFRVTIGRKEAVEEIGQFLNEQFPYPEARKCLRDLEKHHLIQSGTNQDELEFRHQLIQEYYAAEALLERVDQLENEQLKQEFLNFLKWTEPLAFMLALASESQAVHMVKLALKVDLMFGARLAGEVKRDYQKNTVELLTSFTPDALKAELLGRSRSTEAVPFLSHLVKHSDFLVRKQTCEALGKINSEEAILELLSAIPDRDDFVRCSIFTALKDSSSHLAVSGLVQLLNERTMLVRSVVRALLDIGTHEAVKGLIETLETPAAIGGWDAAYALGKIASEQSIAGLIKATSNPNPEIRRRAIHGLSSLEPEFCQLQLLLMLQDESEDVCLSAIKALNKFQAPQVIHATGNFLNHSSIDLRRESIRALAKIVGKESLQILIHQLQDSNEDIRVAAVEAIAEASALDGITYIFEALEDESDKVYQAAIRLLPEVCNERHIEMVFSLLKSESQKVRLGAAICLNSPSIKQQEKLIQALKDPDERVRIRIAKLLGEISSEEAIQSLLDFQAQFPAMAKVTTSCTTRELRCHLIVIAIPQTIRYLVDEAILAKFSVYLEYLNSEDELMYLLGAVDSSSDAENNAESVKIKTRLAQLLNYVSPKFLSEKLIKFIQGDDSLVARQTVLIIKYIGCNVILLPRLEQLISAPTVESNQAINAVFALAEIDSEASREILIRAVRHPNRHVSSTASYTLGRLLMPQGVPGLVEKIRYSHFNYPDMSRVYLGELGEYAAHTVPELYGMISTIACDNAINSITGVQSKCKYYNYRIFEDYLEAQKADRQLDQTSETAIANAITIQTVERLTLMSDKAPIFNQQNAMIGVNYAAEGSKQEFTQHNHTSGSSTEAEQQLGDLLGQLRAKYPSKTDAEIFDILINGFATMPQKNPQNWQRWQDVFSIIFAGGIEATKLLVPVAGIPIEVLKRLYEIYDRNRKQLPEA